jgi:hypothetical protein
MNTQENSINQNGCSVCKAGEEKYTKCVLGAFWGRIYYQYDYRHKDGELFSTLKETLDECRAERDKWLQAKNRKRLFPSIIQRIEAGKRLTKSEMAYQIGHIEPYSSMAISWDFFKRDEIVETFNKMFGTGIK